MLFIKSSVMIWADIGFMHYHWLMITRFIGNLGITSKFR